MSKRKKEIRTKKKEHKEKGQSGKLQQVILSLLEAPPKGGLTLQQIIRKTGAKKKEDLKKIAEFIDTLLESDRVKQLSNGGFISNRSIEEFTGVVDHVNARFAYVNTGQDQDVYVKTKDLGSAFDGDTVKVTILPTRHGEHPEGKVVEVLKRNRIRFVGRIEVSPSFAFVIPDFRKIHQDFFVYPENINGAKTNEKVIVEVVAWAEDDKKPEGKVVEILGKAGENETEIHSIMAEFDLPFRFPESVEKESLTIEEGITKQEIKKRRDFRGISTFTIDPEDAKDFDDALSFRKLENDHYEIGVHIADVTHYVTPNSALEKEAFDRATSVYLVDRTIPMLPEKLSNGLCSLRPNEDKLTFAAVFEVDEKGKIYDQWFGRTIIHSDKRFSYEEAQLVLESGLGPFVEELIILNDLAKKLRKERFAKGAVNFETTEVKFKLDEKGRPLAVIPKIRKDAHKLIEEFMLLANKYVANFIYDFKKGKEKNTFVYRIHDFPGFSSQDLCRTRKTHRSSSGGVFWTWYSPVATDSNRPLRKSLNQRRDEI